MDDFRMNLQFFADAGTVVNSTGGYVDASTGVNVAFTSDSTLDPTMKTFYNKQLLENVKNKHYFAQFGSRQPLPANSGKQMEWRKMRTLPLADVLTEGVIPEGKQLAMTAVYGSISQYGMYVALTDQLQAHAYDPILSKTVEGLSDSAGDTQDTAIRNVVMEGTNVLYADTLDANEAVTATPTGRWGLSTANKFTPLMVHKAATLLRKANAPTIDGNYVCLIHPSVAFDLTRSKEWVEWHKYATPEEKYQGEIGMLDNVRFIVTTTAKVTAGTALTATNRYLTCTATYIENDTTTEAPDGGETSQYKLTIAETPVAAHVGRYVHIYDASATAYVGTVKIIGIDATNKYVWLNAALGITPTTSDLLYPGEGGAEGLTDTTGTAVYGCIFLGKDAYGIIDPEGAGMEMIIKSKAEAGGPLNQYGTAGYKFSGGTKILYQERMVRVECCSSFSKTDASN
jgi:N4-gp56 family major capsid protein